MDVKSNQIKQTYHHAEIIKLLSFFSTEKTTLITDGIKSFNVCIKCLSVLLFDSTFTISSLKFTML